MPAFNVVVRNTEIRHALTRLEML
ncbi:protein of unknown function [Cupriavidus neocaledonicus]|uniref:Uncharacterized protein n=1 Tax=Cupriavidus neocaledonicus TaxID=1040979 RepID=A0A375HDS8_9BURK|nr:protein of unknown function [Cupriavidus neocaledonicus]